MKTIESFKSLYPGTNHSVPSFIEKRLIELGMDTESFASLIGISDSTLKSVVKYSYIPKKPAPLFLMALIFNCDIKDLAPPEKAQDLDPKLQQLRSLITTPQ